MNTDHTEVHDVSPPTVHQLVRNAGGDKESEACSRSLTESLKGDSGPYKAMDQGVTNDGEPSQESIALAVDDIDCKKQTDLVKVWFGVESAIQNEQIADHKSQLTRVKEQYTKEVAAAREQMAGAAR